MMAARRGALAWLSSASSTAIMVSATIWLVYALVEATPISAPALMWMPQLVPRAMALPTCRARSRCRLQGFRLQDSKAMGYQSSDCAAYLRHPSPGRKVSGFGIWVQGMKGAASPPCW